MKLIYSITLLCNIIITQDQNAFNHASLRDFTLKGHSLGNIEYIDLEKNNLTIHYKKTIKLSSSTTREDFKKVFSKSYKSPSYIPGTPPENAVGYTVVITGGKKKAYANFTFYYNQLASVSVSDHYSNMTD